ncbi:MAG TPA: tetratricopeptide repeat protein [Fibrobacteraceae bacterium]|nr:tetratricopeptide repeat protein [Fibrobacteraceae bacterium]
MKLKQIWTDFSPQDRKLIKLTALGCYLVLMISLGAMYFLAKTGKTGEPVQPDSLTASVDSASAPSEPTEDVDSLPPPPPGAQELLAGLDSFDTRAHRELARIYADQQDFQNSLLHARRVAPWLEEDLEFQKQYGQTFLAAGSPAEAIPHLAKAIQLGDTSPEALADLALAKFRGQNPDSGLTAIRSAIKTYPNNPLLATHEAAMFGEVKDHGAAGDSLFRRLVAKFPQYAEARYQYGRFLMNQGNCASSLRELEAAIRLDPLDPRVHARRGMALFYLGRDSEAERAYKTALAMNPRDYNTWYNLGELDLSLANESDRPSVFAKRTRMALEAYLAALANHPDHPEAHYRVGVILNANRQNREAIRHLEIALQHNPRSVPTLLQLAAAWEALGDKSRAWDFAQQAYELDPFNQVVIAQYRRLKGEAENASKKKSVENGKFG